MNVGLYQSAATLSALERWQDVVSQNITSAQTSGYRKRTIQFSSEVAGKWNINPSAKNAGRENEHEVLFTRATNGINFLHGETQPTRRDLDVAIQGEGFFELKGPDGQKFYTRNGEFRMTPERLLVAGAGLQVMTASGDAVTLRPGTDPITINRDGLIIQGAVPLGKLAVLSFDHPQNLIAIAGGMFIEGNNTGKHSVDDPEIMQGYIEASNVQSLREMVDLVLIARAYEANQKIITSIDQQMGKALEALG